MKPRHSLRTRPWIEELEPRVVLSAPAPHFSHLSHATISTTSTNWSGYAVETNFNSPTTNSVSAVYGSWIVPSVTGTGTAYSSFWVGIDGFSSSTVQQIGTDSDLVNGVPTYYAWYEMYPNPSKTVALTIKPGDTINASVVYSAATTSYTLTLTDTNPASGGTFTTTQKAVGAKNNSAEWVAEAPSSFFGVLPLANFGTAQFMNASATIAGTRGPIDSPAWQSASINMVTSSGVAKATTSALNPDTTADGVTSSSFSVAWNSSGVVQRHHGRGGRGGFTDNNPAPQSSQTTSAASANAALSNNMSTNPPIDFNAAIAIVTPAAPVFRNAPIPLNATPLSPILSPATLNGPRADTIFGDDMMDDARATSVWLPAGATTRREQSGALTEVITSQRRPAVIGETMSMQILPGGQAVDEIAEPAEAPTPAAEPGTVAEGNIVTRTFSKAVWLVGAVAFGAHLMFVNRVSEEEERDPAKKR